MTENERCARGEQIAGGVAAQFRVHHLRAGRQCLLTQGDPVLFRSIEGTAVRGVPCGEQAINAALPNARDRIHQLICTHARREQ